MNERAERWQRMTQAQERYLRSLADDPSLHDPQKLLTIADALRFIRDAGALLAEHAEEL